MRALNHNDFSTLYSYLPPISSYWSTAAVLARQRVQCISGKLDIIYLPSMKLELRAVTLLGMREESDREVRVISCISIKCPPQEVVEFAACRIAGLIC